MCLSEVTETRVIPTVEELEKMPWEERYKVFAYDEEPLLENESLGGRSELPLDEILTAENCPMMGGYESGFHTWEKKAGAKNWLDQDPASGGVIVRVRVRGLLAKGVQDRYDATVWQQMIIPREFWDKRLTYQPCDEDDDYDQ
jgi:hypothetical protein